ncbi:hypothetical protein [uncultured Desulfosarcina sp.]|uniref:hypothetical protein n=1 Tax=uncultured Desulfosarcina sp. TaxID=218289 RepID=UPI0029C8280A|nr:hypothetical protein [uncultured Desulfosarcina sp.]
MGVVYEIIFTAPGSDPFTNPGILKGGKMGGKMRKWGQIIGNHFCMQTLAGRGFIAIQGT